MCGRDSGGHTVSGVRYALRKNADALGVKAAKLSASGKRLPLRVSRGVAIALDLLRSALRLELRAGLRRREETRLVRRSDLFDAPFYLSQCAGDPDAEKDPVRHYLLRGAARGLDPSPLFDTSEYVRRNPGVLESGGNPLAHHIRSRATEAASPPESAPLEGAPGEALLAAHPFHASPEGSPCSVLVVDGAGPAPQADVRAGRTIALVEALRGLGHPVILFSAGSSPPRPGAPRAPQPPRQGLAAARSHLEAEGHRYGLVLLTGPDEAAFLLATVRAHAPSARLVYDAAGLHGARLARDAEAARDRAGRQEADRLRDVEKVNAALADLVLVMSAHDRDALCDAVPGARVEVLPHEPVPPSATGERLRAILSAPGLGEPASAATRETAA